MKRAGFIALIVAMLAPPAAAAEFPVGTPYKVISISGFDVQKAAQTLTISRNPNGDGFRGSGHAGCNGWNAATVIRDDQIDFSEIVTTRKFCGKPRMTTEEAFLTALRSAHHWRLDGRRLILEGEAARLLMTPGGAEPEKKTDSKPSPNKSMKQPRG